MSSLPALAVRQALAACESPALYRGVTDDPAFEVKYLLTPEQAIAAEQLLRKSLTPDPHAGRTGAYRVTSLYFDTPEFSVYRRAEGFRRDKYRVRRYGRSPSAYVERKSKADEVVRKKRTAVSVTELADVLSGNGPEGVGWFIDELAERGMRPVSRVSYNRVALIGMGPDGPIRATFDRRALVANVESPTLEPVANGVPLLGDEVVAEFKFVREMPVAFKAVVESLGLSPGRVSKFRRGIERLGLARKMATGEVNA